MTERLGRFQRTSYAHRAGALADELAEWSRIYSSRSYMPAYDTVEARAKERYEEKSEELADLSMQLQRISIRLLALA